MAACDIANVEVRVRFPSLAPKIVGKSSSGKTAVSEAANLGSIPSFPTKSPGDGTGIRTGLRNQVLGVRLPSGRPKIYSRYWTSLEWSLVLETREPRFKS